MCQAVCIVQMQGLSQDLETGCPKLLFVKSFLPSYFSRETTISSDYNHEHVFTYRNKA